MEKRTFIAGTLIGFMMAAVILTIPEVESAIPPTRAIQNINFSIPWSPDSWFLYESESSSDTPIFVSDGSITFNITETYP